MSNNLEARRLRRPSWRDPRLLLGIGLIIASMALGSWAVRSADNRVSVYLAPKTFVPGQEFSTAELRTGKVALDDSVALYLSPANSQSKDSWVAVRTIGSGELLPMAAIDTEQNGELRPVTVVFGTPNLGKAKVGAVIDLWRLGEEGGQPELVASELTISEVWEAAASFGSQGSTALEVLVPADDVGQVLAATDQPDLLRLVVHADGP